MGISMTSVTTHNSEFVGTSVRHFPWDSLGFSVRMCKRESKGRKWKWEAQAI